MLVSKKNFVKITSALLAVITVLVTVFALCACTPADRDGVEIVGIISKEKYPVEITKLDYKLNVSEFPSVSLDGFGDYASYFTVDYELYNPTDSDCEMTLYSPAMLPQYAQREIFSAKQYSVKVNGEDMKVVSRYALNRAGDGSSNLLYCFGGLSDSKIRHDVYNDDCKVYKQTYTVNSSAPYARVEFDVKYSDFIMFKNQSTSVNTLIDAQTIRLKNLSDGDEITAYCVNKPYPDLHLSAKLIPTDSLDKPSEGEYSLSLKVGETEEITFDDLAMFYYYENDGVSSTDYYNAVINSLATYGLRHADGIEQLHVEKSELVQWLQFQLSVPAKGKTSCQVTGPLFPLITEGVSDRNRYEYCLTTSHYSKFATVERMNVDVVTIYSAYDTAENRKFTVTENGYSASLDAAVGNVSLSLFDASKKESGANKGLRVFLIICLVIALLVLIAIPVVIVSVVLAIDRNARRKKSENSSDGKR